MFFCDVYAGFKSKGINAPGCGLRILDPLEALLKVLDKTDVAAKERLEVVDWMLCRNGSWSAFPKNNSAVAKAIFPLCTVRDDGVCGCANPGNDPAFRKEWGDGPFIEFEEAHPFFNEVKLCVLPCRAVPCLAVPCLAVACLTRCRAFSFAFFNLGPWTLLCCAGFAGGSHGEVVDAH